MSNEIFVVPFFGQGHLFPCMELCKHLASRNLKTILIISSNISSSIPSSFHHYPLIEIAQLPSTQPSPPQPGSDPFQHHRLQQIQMSQGLESLLSTRPDNPDPKRPLCAVIDVMMEWASVVFKKFDVPIVGFNTSGACSAAMEYALWKANLDDIKPGEIRLLPGLPEEMGLSDSELKRRPHGPPGGKGGPPGPPIGPPGGKGGPTGPQLGPPGAPRPRMMGPTKPGQQPTWLEEAGDSIAMMINTCHELEGPFIDYLANQIGKPVWGVGPLLPEQFWKSSGSLLHDREIRTNKKSSVTEEEVIEWLDSKPRGSVLYVSFGSEVGPTMEEYPLLADALEASNRPFIWVIQPDSGRKGPPRAFLGQTGSGVDEGYFPHGLDKRVGSRGLIIRGWAPQLLILSHLSTGGFLSHCGWNSTVEAIGRGVPFLAWPIRGDQYYIAKLVVKHLKVGYMISNDPSQMVNKDDIARGIEMLMGDENVKKQAPTKRTPRNSG
ncbi:UDPGT domain-containing protein [Cephalotus follicularis]|uniref:UDPGT domain-containing protein n=1 Tax=Cephalotus follicularis TaxID=3775 RepID=A0A1Q3AZ17_CEPFO|nr:UDPGT domain-containing protein [Cephalotus follicularis]